MTTFIEKQSDIQESMALTEGELETEKLLPERIRRKYVRGSRPARVTKISIEHDDTEITPEAKPRLKTGVQISVPIAEIEKSLIVATAHRAVTIHHPGARSS
jgi:transposase